MQKHFGGQVLSVPNLKKSCPRSKNILGGRIFQFRKSNLRTYKNIRKFSNTKQTPSKNKYVKHDDSDKQKQTIR